jgi:DNA primase
MDAVTMAQLENFDPQPLRQGARTRYLCPLSAMCIDKRRDNAHRSLCVENSSGVFYCHRCGERGKLREFWEERPAQKSTLKPIPKRARLRPVARDIAKAIKLVPEKIPEKIPEKKAEKKPGLEPLRERMKIFAAEFTGSPAERYLEKRKIPKEISAMALCGYASSWEHWEKKNEDWKLAGADRRVVFPVLDEERNLIAIHSRAIDEDHLHSSKITRGNKSQGVFYSSPDVFLSPVVAIC